VSVDTIVRDLIALREPPLSLGLEFEDGRWRIRK